MTSRPESAGCSKTSSPESNPELGRPRRTGSECSRPSAPSLLNELAEEFGERMRRQTRLPEGTDARAFVAACGLKVVEVQLEAFEGFHIPGTRTLYLSPQPYEPRNQFTLFHELAEARRPPWIPAEWKEKWCDRAAAALLLPRTAFTTSLVACRWDLAALRRRWRHASYEAIASRIVDVMPGVSMSTWRDELRRYRRGEAGAELEQAEYVALAQAYAGRGMAIVRTPDAAAVAWRLGGIRTKHAITLTLAA